MKRNKHLLLWSSLGTLMLLGWAAYEEHFAQEWRRLQRDYQARLPSDRGEDFSVQLRQVVIPDLGLTDRCVSCHVGMAPGESAIEKDPVFGAHTPVVHDPARYGCTVCHGGQGRATRKEDAHGTARYWPEPMLPRGYSYAGCGSCHTHLTVPSIAALERGRSLVERYDCLRCHALEGRGGTFRPETSADLISPDLSLAGSRPLTGWYEGHLAKARAAELPSWTDSFRPVPAEDLSAINVFLSSRLGAPGLIESKAVFHSLGCRGCHVVAGVGGDDGPDLSNTGRKDPGQIDFARVRGRRTLENWMKEHFRAPSVLVPGSLMPALGLSEQDIDRLTFYMLSLRSTDFPGAYWPRDRVRAQHLGEREFAGDGATLYQTFCYSCHGARGEGMRYARMTPFPAIGNADFLALASDDFIAQTVRRGRPGRRMPAWGEKDGGLRPSEILAVVEYVRSFGGGLRPGPEDRPRWVRGDAEAGKRLYLENCGRCHGETGQGSEGPALSNDVFLTTATDTYLVETVRRGRQGTTMPGFAAASTTHRQLATPEIESIVAFIRNWETRK